MVAHILNSQLDKSKLPASLSYDTVTGELRNKLHYQGVVITDDMDATAIRDFFKMKEAIYLAVHAGNNIILYGGTQAHNAYKDANELYSNLSSLAENNKSFCKHVTDSYHRIEHLKSKLTLSIDKSRGVLAWHETKN